jgi:aminocarboxymuconate-semialdehyde decarboxylase
MPLMGPIPEGRSFFCPHCGALYSVTDTRRPKNDTEKCARSDAHGALPHPPTRYLKKIYVDSVVFTPHQLAELVRLFGVDHVVMGTGYPFDMAKLDPIGHLASVEGLDASAAAAIAGGNARRLLGL